jgi:hypothetical protein
VSTLTTLARRLANLERRRGRLARPPLLDALAKDPAQVMSLAGLSPDPWQAGLLRSRSSRTLMLCGRQSGKSRTAAALALREALLRPGSLVLLLSPTLRQSGELFRDKVLTLYQALGAPVPRAGPRDNALRLELANGSRVVALPGEEGTVRGYSGVRLLVIDEAARVPDALYYSVRPMLAVSKGLLVALSTPWGKRGWFYEEWISGRPWQRVRVTADQCPRITPEFLAEEEAALGEHFYRQEYHCEFRDCVEGLFRQEDIDAALGNPAVVPLFPPEQPEPWPK